MNERLFDGTGRADSAAKAGRLNALDVSSNVFIMKKEVNNWIAGADYDLGTAEHLLKGGRYLYAVFMCHLCVEKLLKAKIAESSEGMPPRTHDLKHLLSLTELRPTEERLEFISQLSNLSVATRYPEDFKTMLTEYSEPKAISIYEKTEQVSEWIKKSLKP